MTDPTSDDLRAKVQEAGKYASGIMTDIDLLRWAADRIDELEAENADMAKHLRYGTEMMLAMLDER